MAFFEMSSLVLCSIRVFSCEFVPREISFFSSLLPSYTSYGIDSTSASSVTLATDEMVDAWNWQDVI
jgi:hypothetical protein